MVVARIVEERTVGSGIWDCYLAIYLVIRHIAFQEHFEKRSVQ